MPPDTDTSLLRHLATPVSDGGHGFETERLGFAYCPDAMHLFELLPAGDTVIVG